LGLEKPNSGLDPGKTYSGSDLDSNETFQISRNVGLDIDEIVCLLDSQLWLRVQGISSCWYIVNESTAIIAIARGRQRHCSSRPMPAFLCITYVHFINASHAHNPLYSKNAHKKLIGVPDI
jgi:hypothetical protein